MFRAAVPRGEPVPVRVVLVAEPAQHQQPVPREGDVRRLVVVPRQRLPVLLPVSGLPHPASHHPAPSLGTQMDRLLSTSHTLSPLITNSSSFAVCIKHLVCLAKNLDEYF